MSFLYSAALVTLADLNNEVLVKFYTKFLITASHGREIYAFDPAGNRLILHQSH